MPAIEHILQQREVFFQDLLSPPGVHGDAVAVLACALHHFAVLIWIIESIRPMLLPFARRRAMFIDTPIQYR